MALVFGIVLVALAVAAFSFSLPRGGKTARFVGTQSEGYLVVAMLCTFGVGLMLAVSGAAQLLK
jgi:hypothetical protein